jgi:pyruvate/2-oxoglutarate dehydrogenase complex dihydrolipoamide dehydrogenase (E3) component
MHRHVQEVIAAIAPHDSVERFEGLGAHVIRAEARFIKPRVLTAGDIRVRARRVIIATGSSASAPPIEGLDGVDYFTNESIFANETLPEHLLILGGGPIGMELAQAHRRLGAKVTVAHHLRQPRAALGQYFGRQVAILQLEHIEGVVDESVWSMGAAVLQRLEGRSPILS